MSIATLVTRGFGSFGSTDSVVTRGFTPGPFITVISANTPLHYSITSDGAYDADASAVTVIEASGVGQNYDGDIVDYNILQAYFEFDTSAVGSNVIESVVLSAVCVIDASVTDFTVNVKNYTYSTPITTAHHRTGTQLASLDTIATFDSSAAVETEAGDFTSLSGMNSHINPTGTTTFLMASSRQESATAPTGFEYLVYSGATLTITHAPATGSVGSSTGTSAVSGISSATALSTGASIGTSSVSGAGAAAIVSEGSSVGTSSVSGVASALAIMMGGSSGTSSVLGTTSALASSIGASVGASSVSGILEALALSTGVSTGTSSVSGTGSALAIMIGSSLGTSSVNGVGITVIPSVGLSSGSSVALVITSALKLSTGLSTGVGSISGVGVAHTDDTPTGTPNTLSTDVFTLVGTGHTLVNSANDITWTLQVFGNMGGCFVQVEASMDDSNWSVTPYVLTTNRVINFNIISPYVRVRLVRTASTVVEDINVKTYLIGR